MENLFECPLCSAKAAKIFARDNTFLIFKCAGCGFMHYNKISGKVKRGVIEGEKPYGSGKVRETYFRTPNSPYGGSFLDALMSTLEELSKHGPRTCKS
jgi:hypothetical protein